MIRRSLLIVLLSICAFAAAGPGAGAIERVEIAQGAPATQPTTQESTTPPATTGPTPAPAPAPVISPSDDTAEAKVNPPTLEELLAPIGKLTAEAEAAERNLARPPEGQKELAVLRASIEQIGLRAKEAADALRPRLEEVRTQIAKLGEPPAQGAPPEEPEVAAERDRLNALAAQIDGAIKKAGLIEVRAQQLVGRVQHVRQGVFTRFLLRQTGSPLQPAVWRTAAEQLPAAAEDLRFILTNWWHVAMLRWPGLVGVLAAGLGLYIVLRWLTRRFIRKRLDGWTDTPSGARRAAYAVWVTAALALPAVAAAFTIYIGFDELGLLYWRSERLARALLFSFLVVVGVSAMARALLQPSRPHWRLFDLGNESAATVRFAIVAISVAYALDYLAWRVARILSLSTSVSIVTAFLASLAIAAFLLLIVRTPLAPRELAPGAPVSRWRPLWFKLPLLALIGVVLGASLFGYVSLGRYFAGQLLMTGSVLLIAALLHKAIDGLRPAPADTDDPVGRMLTQSFKLDEPGRQNLLRALRLLLNLGLLAVAAPLILLGWGVSGSEMASWLRKAVLGFELGGVQISLLRILAALTLFALLLAATRVFQRWLATRALPASRLDPGVVNSIHTGAGYLGFAVALLVAVAYAGFDITSLAIVAGALSVGIGFGLQSIVNNFVSGLVLLVERPIKVGDWIATRDGEGYVRRISVRATEIETFDRASLIVPNSELITQTVRNLTHRNQLGRLNISVRVAYATDPELAQKVLQEVADANTSILRHPPPMVVLDNLGDQALEYSLRVYLADVNRSLAVQTELRTQVLKALRAAGIDIPYAAVQVGHASGPRLAPHRAVARISTALTADPYAVLGALEAAARRCEGALQEPEPEATFDNVTERALEFSITVAIPDDAEARQVESALRAAAVKTLRERSIALAGGEPPQALDGHDGNEGARPRAGAEVTTAPHKPNPV